MIKTYQILFLILITISCESKKKYNKDIHSKISYEQNISSTKTNIISQMDKELDENIFEEIKNYYHDIYDEKSTRVKEIRNDSITKYTYYTIYEGEGIEGYIISIFIPNKSNFNLFLSNPILYGDLNGDKVDDIVVSVHTEGGGNGSNTSWQDFFVFLNQNGNYLLKSVSRGYEICGCEKPMGFIDIFRTKKIEKGYLIGESHCYTTKDAHCCPSLLYLTKVKLKNDKLEFYSKEFIREVDYN